MVGSALNELMGARASPTSSQSSEEKMNIYLKVIKTVALEVGRSDTLRDLKAMIREKEGVSENFQELYYGGHHLKDELKLVDCGIQKNSTLHLVLETSAVVKLVIRISSMQKIIEIEAKRQNTIYNIRMMIQKTEGICLGEYNLFYGGKLLENSWTLASLGMSGEAILYLVFSPKDVLLLSVKLPNGDTLETEVKILYTVLDVKDIIGSIVGIRFRDHNLVYGGKQLEDSLTLASYNIDEESILEIVPRPFQIFVKLSSGNTITLDVCQQDTVSDVINKSYKKHGNQAINSGCYLEFAGKRLEDSLTLASYNIDEESILEIVPGPFQIYVKLLSGNTITLDVCQQDTVSDVRNKSYKKHGNQAINSCCYLEFAGKRLEDSLTLASYNIDEESILEIVPGPFQIFVKLLSGDTITLDVCQQDTVLDVRNKSYKKHGNQVFNSCCYLEFAGKRLEEDKKLAKYGIEKHSTINMVQRAIGSLPPVMFSEIEGSSELPESTSICHLKKLIQKKLPSPLIEVLVNGRAMRDNGTLASYAIKKDTMITRVIIAG